MVGIFINFLLGLGLAAIVFCSIRKHHEPANRRAIIMHALAWGAGLNLVGAMHYSTLGAFYDYGDPTGYQWLFIPSFILLVVCIPPVVYFWARTLLSLLRTNTPCVADTGTVSPVKDRLGLTGLLILIVPIVVYIAAMAVENRLTSRSFATLRAEETATERAVEEKRAEKLEEWRKEHGDETPPEEVTQVSEEEIEKPFPLMELVFGIDLVFAGIFLFRPYRRTGKGDDRAVRKSGAETTPVRIPLVTPLAAAALVLFVCYIFYPGESSFYVDQAYVKLEQGELEDAIKDYTKVIELKPEWANGYLGRGVAWERAGDFDRAISDYTKVIELDPNNEQAYFNRGNAKCANGNFEGAIKDYGKAIELGNKHMYTYTYAYNNRGDAKREMGDLDGAIEDYNMAIDLKPDWARPHVNRGLARERKGNNSDAIADYSKVIEFDPESKYSVYAYFRICSILASKEGQAAARQKAGTFLADREIEKEWPRSALRFFAGEIDETDLLEATGSENRKIEREQTCAAYFYAAEMRLARDDINGAKELFKKCVDTDARTAIVYDSARFELERLESKEED
ncbi:MAG: tetratricopeptide repeat protein [Planctomycetota bacterium]|jgi:lipoprotein NlpI